MSIKRSLLPLVVSLVVSASAMAHDVTLNGTISFASLDGSAEDHDGVANGVFTVDDGNLTIAGTIQCNDDAPLPLNASACPISIAVSGDLILQSGGALFAENRRGAGAGGDVTLVVGGDLVLRGPSGGLPGAIVSTGRSTDSIDRAGAASFQVGGDVVLEPGSVVAASTVNGPAGAITISADGRVAISGLVVSGPSRQVLATARTGRVLDGGKSKQTGGEIVVRSHGTVEPAIRVEGDAVVVSQGEASGPQLVLLEGCGIEVRGLVASMMKTNGSSRVVLRSGKDLLVDGRDLGAPAPNDGRLGRVRADGVEAGSSGFRVDLYAEGEVEVRGPSASGVFAVSSSPGPQGKRTGGVIAAMSLGDSLAATGNAFEAGKPSSGNQGGSIDLHAAKDVNLDGATLAAVGDWITSASSRRGGRISVRAYQGALSWAFGTGDVRPTGAGVAAAARGSISLTACKAMDMTGTSFPTAGRPVPGFPAETIACAPAAPQLPEGEDPLVACTQPPSADDDAYAVDEGGTLDVEAPGVLDGDTDADGNPLTAHVADEPLHASAFTLNADGSFHYVHDGSETTSDTFTYRANDGSSDSNVATVTITIHPVNDPPSADADAYSVDEGDKLVVSAPGVLDGDTDAEHDALTAILVSAPSHASSFVLNADGSFTYTHDGGETTSDSFTYQANDGAASSVAATVTITIHAVDDPPHAVNDAATVAEGSSASAIDVLANDTDPDAGPKSVTSITQPANGIVVITGGGTGVTYAPNAGFCNSVSGPADTFTYTLSPGGSVATVSVTVTCSDDPPTAVADAATVNEDSGANAIDVLANDSDPDGGPKSITSVTQPLNGTVVITGGGTGLTYTPNANFCNGSGAPDLFSYTLTPGGSSAAVSVTVTCVDDGPVAVADAATVVEDSSANTIDVLANDTDIDGGPKTVTSVTQPANGTVVITGGGTGVAYTPNANWCSNPATDSFTYTLTPGGSSATVIVTVTCVDDPPTAVADAATVLEDSGTNAIAVLANDTDPDGGAKSISAITQPANGFVVITGGGTGVAYTPNANWCSNPTTDSFTYTLTPGGSSATVLVTVTCVDDSPTAVADAATVFEDSGANAIAVLANDTDPDGGPKSVASVTQPANGVVVITGGGAGVSYAPNANACNSISGIPDTFTYTLTPGGSSATVSVSVTCVNDPPVTDAQTFDFIGNTELRVDLDAGTTPAVPAATPSTFGVLDGDADVEGNAFSVTGITVGSCSDATGPTFDCTDPAVGTVHMQSNGRFSFLPAAGDTALTETFQYIVTDDGVPAASSVGTVTLHRVERVWWVDPAASGGGNGTSTMPLNSLASLNGAGGVGDFDYNGDYIFIETGSLSGAIELEGAQHLLGKGAGLSIPVGLNGNPSPTVLAAEGTRPQLTNGSGDAVRIGNAMPVEIRGLSLASTTGNAIDLTTTSFATTATLTIADNEFRGAGAEGIDVNLNAGTSGTLTLAITDNVWNASGTHVGNAIDVSRAAGTLRLDVSRNTGITSSATAVSIAGGSIAATTITGFSDNSVSANTGGGGVVVSNATFDASPALGGMQQVDGDSLHVGLAADPVGGAGVQLSGVQGNLFFDDLDVYAGTSGLTASGAGLGLVLAVTPASPDGAGTSVISASGGAALDLATATVDLRLADLDSTTTGAGVSLSAISGVVKAGAGASITKLVGAGTAFSVANSVSGTTVSYGGTLNVASGGGVSLTNNSGSTIAFSGGMTLSTGASAGFVATGGGTVTVTDPAGPAANTIATTTGNALTVTGTTIGTDGLTFQSISAGTAASGPTNGIVLDNTGSSAGLTVTGNGAAGTGGQIQKAGIGISLTSTRKVALSWMHLNDTSDFAIRGNGVVDFSLANSVIDGANGDNDALDEASVRFTGLTGSASFTNTKISGGLEDNVTIINDSGTLDPLTFSAVEIGANSTLLGNDGILIESMGTATIRSTIENSFFTGARGDLLQVALNGNSTQNLVLTGNAFSNNHPNVVSGGGGITIGGGSGQSVTFTFNISNNTFRDALGTAVLLFKGLDYGTTSGTFANNTIGVDGVANSGSAQGSGLYVGNTGEGTLNVAVTGNSIYQYNNQGISIAAGGGGATGGNLNVTVTGNTISKPGTNGTYGLYLNGGTNTGSTFQICATLGGAGTLANSLTGSGGNGMTDFYVRQRNLTTVRLPGYAGANTDTAAVVSFLQANNGGTPTGNATQNVAGGGGGFVGGAACVTP